MHLLLMAIALVGLSGVPGLAFGRRSALGQWITTLVMVTGSVLGIAATLGWLGKDAGEIVAPWDIPIPGGEFHVVLDDIAVVFLMPVLLVPMLGSIYGLTYWKQSEHPRNGRKLRLFYGLLPAGMALLVVAHNTLLFLVAWEIMALSAYLLVTTEDEQANARGAGWIYLVATHTAMLALFGLFSLERQALGSYSLLPASDQQIAPAAGMFLLALLGFGLKAGLMPLHVWLPSSHATAPSHVSAVMSGVIIKMGIYGLVRFTSIFPHPPLWWGASLLALGVISGVLGVAFAIGQHDLKRLLAYHSVENIGIIVMGLGLALVGRSLGRLDWVVLGMGGALLHVWNHALFKSLLFLSAGSVIHGTHTRELDHLGGLSKSMPWTAACFLVGAVAICGLPPLNGFISEFLIYNGLFRTLGIGAGADWPVGAFAAPALALMGALAAGCFIKVFGVVFLGVGRSGHARHAHESGPAMIGPMLVLAGCCASIGLYPLAAAPLLDKAILAWAPEVRKSGWTVTQLAPLDWLSGLAVSLLGITLLAWLYLNYRFRRGEVGETATWGCGYAAPNARMQYTASSIAQMFVNLFAWALWPKAEVPRLREHFPSQAVFYTRVPDVVLERLVLPVTRLAVRISLWFRFFQQGSVQAYLAYILAILMVLLLYF